MSIHGREVLILLQKGVEGFVSATTTGPRAAQRRHVSIASGFLCSHRDSHAINLLLKYLTARGMLNAVTLADLPKGRAPYTVKDFFWTP